MLDTAVASHVGHRVSTRDHHRVRLSNTVRAPSHHCPCANPLRCAQDLKTQVDAWHNCGEGQQLSKLQHENAELRMQLKAKQQQLGGLQQGDIASATAGSGQLPNARPLTAVDMPAIPSGSCHDIASRQLHLSQT